MPGLSWNLIETVAALLIQGVAAILWVKLYGRIRRWSWWCCFFGIALTMAHRVSEVTGRFWLGHFTAVAVSLGYVFAVVMATRAVVAEERRVEQLNNLQQQREILEHQVQEQKGAALALAMILNDLKTRIEYYEHQANDHGLPLFLAAEPSADGEI